MISFIYKNCSLLKSVDQNCTEQCSYSEHIIIEIHGNFTYMYDIKHICSSLFILFINYYL